MKEEMNERQRELKGLHGGVREMNEWANENGQRADGVEAREQEQITQSEVVIGES